MGALWGWAGLCVGSGTAAATPTPDDLLREVRAAQRAGEVAVEVALCTRAVAEHGGDRVARVCDGRLATLEPRRDPDGGFSGLQRLRAVQASDGKRQEDVQEVTSVAVDPSVAVAVRHDAAIWLARHHLQVADDPRAALEWSTPLWDAFRAGGLLADQADVAADTHARALARAGSVAEARAVEAERAPVRSSRPSEGVPAELRRRSEARLLEVAGGVVAVFLGVCGGLSVRSVRQRGWARPGGLWPLAVAIGGVGLLVAAWDLALVSLVGALGAWAVVAHCLTAQASGAVHGWGRWLLGALGAAGTLAGGLGVLSHQGALGLLQ